MSNLSQIEKISLQNQIDAELLLQNDRIGQASKNKSYTGGLQSGYISGLNASGQFEAGINKPDLYTFSRPNQKIIDEYVKSNYQPYEFEKDANGNLVKKFRYKIPQDEPELEKEKDIDTREIDIEYGEIEKKIEASKETIEDLSRNIRENEESIRNIQNDIQKKNDDIDLRIIPHEENIVKLQRMDQLITNSQNADTTSLSREDYKHYVERHNLLVDEAKLLFKSTTRSLAKINSIQSDIYKLKGEIKICNENIEFFKKEMDQEGNKYNNLDSRLKQIDNIYNEASQKNATIRNKNVEKVNAYADTLQLLNRNAFNVVKDPLETEEEYLNRLKQNAQMEAPEMLFEDASYEIMREFKEKIKELIKNPVAIEQICNSIDTIDKNELLKQWPKVKKTFIDKYGENNSRIDATEIVNFLNNVFKVSETATLLGKLVKEESVRQNIIDNRPPGVYGHIDPSRDFVYIIEKVIEKVNENNSPKHKLYLIPVTNGLKINPRLGILYSINGKKTPIALQDKVSSFQEFPVGGGRFNEKDLNKILIDILKNTGLTADDILENLQTPDFAKRHMYNGLIDIGVKPLVEEPGDKETFKVKNTKISSSERPYVEEYGYGITQENLPKLVQFGKLKINLKKLKYDNILSLKNANGTSIGGLPNMKISERFSKILLNMLKGSHPHRDDLTSLHTNEKQVYDRILVMAGLHKTIVNDHDETLSDIKKRINLLMGEIEIGNDSPLIKTELKQLAQFAYSMKGITLKEYNRFIDQFE